MKKIIICLLLFFTTMAHASLKSQWHYRTDYPATRIILPVAATLIAIDLVANFITAIKARVKIDNIKVKYIVEKIEKYLNDVNLFSNKGTLTGVTFCCYILLLFLAYEHWYDIRW